MSIFLVDNDQVVNWYSLFTFIISAIGGPSDIYFLFKFRDIFFLIVLIFLFYPELIQELKKIEPKKILEIGAFSILFLFIINLIPNEIEGSLSLFFLGADTYEVVLEEMFFRFCMINLQTTSKTQYGIILFSAFLFSIVQGGEIGFLLMDFLLGVVYIKTKNIWYSILIHMTYNCLDIFIYFYHFDESLFRGK